MDPSSARRDSVGVRGIVVFPVINVVSLLNVVSLVNVDSIEYIVKFA